MEAVLDIHVRNVRIKSSSIQILVRCIFYKKRFMEKYLCWFAHEEHYIPYDIMIERMVSSTSNSSNVHRVVDDSNPYRIMAMNAMRMNHGYASKCSSIDGEPNVDATRFFEILKDSDEPL